MTSRDFCYWLQGFFEIGDEGPPRPDDGLSPKQVATIRRHLSLVFAHEIDPAAGPPAHQAALDALHTVANQGAPKTPHPPIGGDGPGGLKYRY